MNLFKAMIMCEECGEIHAEKWLTSVNRHATSTILYVLCDACMENELRLAEMCEEDDSFDVFKLVDAEPYHNIEEDEDYSFNPSKHTSNIGDIAQIDPFANYDVKQHEDDFDPFESEEADAIYESVINHYPCDEEELEAWKKKSDVHYLDLQIDLNPYPSESEEEL